MKWSVNQTKERAVSDRFGLQDPRQSLLVLKTDDKTKSSLDLSELVPEGQKACQLDLLCREGLLYFQEFARPRKPRTQGSPPAAE